MKNQNEINQIKDRLINKLLFLSMLNLSVALVSSIIRWFEIGFQPIYVFHTLVFVSLAFCTLYRKHLSLNIKVHFLGTLYLFLSVVGLYFLAHYSAYFMVLVTVSMVTILLGRKPAYYYGSLFLVIYIVNAWLHITNKISIQPDLNNYANLLTVWGTFFVGLLTLFVILIEGFGVFYNELIHSINTRITTTNELRKSETFRSQVFDSSRLPIVVMEADTFRYIDCNPASVSIYGYTSKEQVIGLTPMDVSAPVQYDGTASPEKALFFIEKAKNEKSVVFEWKHQRPDGTVWDAEVHLLSFSVDGRAMLQFSLLDITDKKEAEKALKQSERKYYEAIEFLPVPIGIAIGDKIIHQNKEFVKTYGYTVEDVSSISRWMEMVYPDPIYREEVAKIWEKDVAIAIQTKSKTPRREYKLRCKDNTEKWVAIIGSTIGEQLLSTFEDITLRKKAEQELILSKKKAEENGIKLKETLDETLQNKLEIAALLEAAKEIPLSDSFTECAQKIFDICKKAIGAKSGYVALLAEDGSENEVLFLDAGGLPCTVAPELPMPIRGLREVAYRNNDCAFDNDFMHSEWVKFMPHGHVKLDNVLFAPLIVDKKAAGLIGLANKVGGFTENDAKLANAFGNLASIGLQLSNNKDKLILAKEKAEESDRLKTAFLHNLSHEIRTPMNAICGFSGMLNNPDLSKEKQNSFITIIQNSSNQLLSIITDILTISSLDTKQEKLNIQKVTINNILIDLLTTFKPQAQKHNVSLFLNQQLSSKHSEIFTDKTKITQILTNLLSNAVKFTNKGQIEFGYNLKTDTKSVALEFYVKDTGIGIAPEIQSVIFDRFRQAETIHVDYGGSGLGLSISKGFVELLDGKIWVVSEIDKGSTFYFTIPYKPVNEINESTTPTKQNENFKTILVAEDEEYNFLFIEELLIDLDLKLIHAKDGKETVEIFKTNPNIGLILMDIKMPIMTGHEAAIIIKELKPNIPIVAQSAYALEHERAKYEGIFDDYLPKPINENDLKQIVKRYIEV